MDEVDSSRSWLDEARSRLSARQSASADTPASAADKSDQHERAVFGWCAYEVWWRQIREPRDHARSAHAG
jgi:hypothetical protein